MKSLLLFSGGQDSTTCLLWAKHNFEEVEAMTFQYGQIHQVELDCAKEICHRTRTSQKLIDLSFLEALNSNALTDSHFLSETSSSSTAPSPYFVPGRNALFLTVAAAYALPRGIKNLIIGACQVDYSGYPDCREDFISSQEKTLSLAMNADLKIHTPLMNLSKEEIFKLADNLGYLEDLLELSHSCYKGIRDQRHPWGYGCKECPACLLRIKGFEAFRGKYPRG